MKTKSAVLLFALLCGVLSLTGCGGDNGSPQAAVKGYHESLKAKDKERMKNCLSKEDLKNFKDDAEVKEDSDTSGDYEIGAVTEDGDKATVLVTYTDKDGKKSDPMKYHCVKEDGNWKVAMGVTFTEMLKDAFKAG